MVRSDYVCVGEVKLTPCISSTLRSKRVFSLFIRKALCTSLHLNSLLFILWADRSNCNDN